MDSKVSQIVPRRVRGRSQIEDSEILAASIYMLAHGITYHASESQFGVSASYLNKVIRTRLEALVQVLREDKYGQMKLPKTAEEIARESRKWTGDPSNTSDTQYAFLSGCIGAADGSLIPLILRKNWKPERYRSRYGYTCQNVLAIADFDRCFSKMWDGGEGAASDTMMIKFANMTDHIPDGAFVLFDAGGYHHQKILLPFPSTRYHLKEFSDCPPETPEELFNLRHSSRRASRIECAFGIWKGRFRILKTGLVCKDMQTAQIITRATAYLHNFITRRDMERKGKVWSSAVSQTEDSDSDTANMDSEVAATLHSLAAGQGQSVHERSVGNNSTFSDSGSHTNSHCVEDAEGSSGSRTKSKSKNLADVKAVSFAVADRIRLESGKTFQASLRDKAWDQYLSYQSRNTSPEVVPRSDVQLLEDAEMCRRNEPDDRFFHHGISSSRKDDK